MIPASALQQDAQGFYSWVLTADNTVTMRRCARRSAWPELRGGRWPESGERVVTEGAQRLRDGAAVQLLSE
jgi:multidrug efflux pump subunit AcrA (membrane-fusion protein)